MKAMFCCFVSVALLGCSTKDTTGSHIGNPATLTVVATSALTSDDATLTITDQNQTRYHVKHLKVVMRDIRLRAKTTLGCDDIEPDALIGATCQSEPDGVSIRVGGPLVVDLLKGTATPSLSVVRIPVLTYERIDYRLDDGSADDGITPQDLIDRSLSLGASFEFQGQPVELSLRLKFNEDARVERGDTQTLVTGGQVKLLFELQRWFDNIPLTQCLDDEELKIENGVLLIDDNFDGCKELEGVLKANIKNSTRLSN